MAEARTLVRHAVDDRGVTLVELVVVVGVIVVLVGALGFEFQDWMARYKIESQAKELYTEVMNLRAKAMSVGRSHFVYVPGGKVYKFFEDVDGDGFLDAPAILSKEARYELISSDGTKTFAFNNRGVLVHYNSRVIMGRSFSVRLIHTKEPDYDCIDFNLTRINLGAWNGAECETK